MLKNKPGIIYFVTNISHQNILPKFNKLHSIKLATSYGKSKTFN